eukprot:NODE_3665_length_1180_cov_126.691580_g3481_i0.p1 GENE.NODE_3665_length_1180_cov_126.691580_g3481_i0~~NODE_3665_length_1180_cov_126.691580_g3481_i0.p1  ORF type:complete len:351 (+),score=58.60 NODE_3665_length_1180_cov_126.691580_g3481_i0:59-1054(+)
MSVQLSGQSHPCTRYGECHFGATCKYASLPIEACRYFLKGGCTRPGCPDLHVDMTSAMALGQEQLASGMAQPPPQTLKRGREDMLPAHLQGLNLSGRLHPCLKMGTCNFGDKCQFRDLPIEACRYFAKGKCQNVVSCPGLHLSTEDVSMLHAAGVLVAHQQQQQQRPAPMRDVRAVRGMQDVRAIPGLQDVRSQLQGLRDVRDVRAAQPSSVMLPVPTFDLSRAALPNQPPAVKKTKTSKGYPIDATAQFVLQYTQELLLMGKAFQGGLHPCTQFGECTYADTCDFKNAPIEVCRYHIKGTCKMDPCKNVHMSFEQLKLLGYDVPVEVMSL